MREVGKVIKKGIRAKTVQEPFANKCFFPPERMRKSVLVPAGKSLESPSQRRLLPFRASKRSSKNPRKRRKPQRREGKSKRKKRRTRRQPQRRKPLQRQLRLKNPKKTLSARPRKQFHTKIAIDRPNHCVLAEKRGFVPPQTTRHKKIIGSSLSVGERNCLYLFIIFFPFKLMVSHPGFITIGISSPPSLRQGQHRQRPRSSSAGLCCGLQSTRCWFGCDHGDVAGASKLPTFFSLVLIYVQIISSWK